MTLSLDGKTAVITGAAQGIGRATAELFARAGAKVVATDVNAAKLEELEGPGIERRVLNVLDDAAVRDAMAAIGRVDVLFNCAGVVHGGTILEMPDADLDFALDLNVKALVRTSRAVLPGMIAAGGGSIVCTSSISAVAGTPMEVLYDTTKGAVHMFARAIAVEFRDRGIRCNAVCPGFIRTPHGLSEIAELARYGVDASEAALAAQQGRIGEPEDVARAALYLASDQSAFITGTHLFVDNGFTAV